MLWPCFCCGTVEFTEQRIEQHRWSVFRYIAVGMIVFAVVSLTVSPILGLMAGVVVAVGAKANFKQWGNWSAGKEGEVAVTEALRFLPNEYVLLNDLMLPNGRGNVDHLVIGPNGIFVIETKNYSGYVKCWGDQWYVNRREIGSLSKQAKRNAMAIRNTLDMVFKDHSTRIPFVNALLVFTLVGVDPRHRAPSSPPSTKTRQIGREQLVFSKPRRQYVPPHFDVSRILETWKFPQYLLIG